MESFRERNNSRCAEHAKSQTLLVREESCFPIVDLGEALDIVGEEVRAAVHIRLRQLSSSRRSPVVTSACQGDNSQLLEKTDPPDLEKFVGKATSRYDSATRGGTEDGLNKHNVGADFGDVEDCVLETVGPPFLGRHVGSPNGVSAPFALPPFRASLVDGYAVHIPLGKCSEGQQLYKKTTPRCSVETDASDDRKGRLALRIVGEVRAGADLTRDGVQPFRRHPHIWDESGGSGLKSGARFHLKNQFQLSECVDDTIHEHVPISLKCVYVTTGSPVPEWCNAVVPVENCEVDVDNCLCWPDLEAVWGFAGDGDNIREVGADAPADTVLLQHGQLVGPAEEGMLAAIGLERLEVFRKLNVHTLALGDELRSRGAPDTLKKDVCANDVLQNGSGYVRDKWQAAPPYGGSQDHVRAYKVKHNPVSATREAHNIRGTVYDSNSPMLRALLSQHCPSTYVGQHHALPDDVDEVQRLLLSLALRDDTFSTYVTECSENQSHRTKSAPRALQDRYADVLVSTGGVSMGGSDCMKLALLQLQRNTLQHHIYARCTDYFKKQKIQHGLVCLETAPGATSESVDDTNLSKEGGRTVKGRQPDSERQAAISVKTEPEPPAPLYRCHIIETEIKFGRINVKPGKPAMFAVLRVFSRHSGEVEVGCVKEAGGRPLCEPVFDAPAQQANTSNKTIQSRRDSPSHASIERPDSGPASTNVKRLLSSYGKHRSGRQVRKPIRTLLVFALPGNPCSAWVLFHLLVAPSLNFYSSFCPSTSLSTHIPAQTVAILDEPVIPDSTRPEYHRVLVYVGRTRSKAGVWESENSPTSQVCRSIVGGWTASAQAAPQLYAFPTGIQTSSRLLSCCASANGLIVVTPSKVTKRVRVPAGETVPILLCGPPFPNCPKSLIDLVRMQNKPSGLYKTRCKCGGGTESSVDAFTPTSRSPLPVREVMIRVGEVRSESPLWTVASSNNLHHITEIPASHFEHSKLLGEPVNLGIVIVSDRCYRGDTQDSCADALLDVLQKSSAVAALLRLRSKEEHLGHDVQNTLPPMRAEDDKAAANKRASEPVEKQFVRTQIVPDQIESIRTAVLSTLCPCVHDAEKVLETDANHPLSRRSLVFVCGGTGISPRDVTPQALLPLFALRCSGIEHLLLEYSLRCTPLAALGRPSVGVIECGPRTQMRQGNGTNCCIGRSMRPLATEKHNPTPAPGAAHDPPEVRCIRTAWLPEEPAGFAGVVIDKCCCHREACALPNLQFHKGTPARQDLSSSGKHDSGAQDLPGSTAVAPGSKTAGARETVCGERAEVSGGFGGCGARCMVVVFPGSPKAVRENATALLPVLPHALGQL